MSKSTKLVVKKFGSTLTLKNNFGWSRLEMASASKLLYLFLVVVISHLSFPQTRNMNDHSGAYRHFNYFALWSRTVLKRPTFILRNFKAPFTCSNFGQDLNLGVGIHSILRTALITPHFFCKLAAHMLLHDIAVVRLIRSKLLSECLMTKYLILVTVNGLANEKITRIQGFKYISYGT